MAENSDYRFWHPSWRMLRSIPVRTLRSWSAGSRALPDFLILGAQKAGTTSFYSYLVQHPQVIGAIVKEVHYFDHHYENGDKWYRRHFPMIRTLREHGAITGECTPHYLFHPRCAERIYALLPSVKLIAILRNPVERAISHYFMEVNRGNETQPIDLAMISEKQRVDLALQLMETQPVEGSLALAKCSYKSRGIYVDQLERFLQFFPRDQLLVIKAEDLRANTVATLNKTFGHLGLSQDFIPRDLGLRNVRADSAHIPMTVRDSLTAFFQPHNERLSKLMGIDFIW